MAFTDEQRRNAAVIIRVGNQVGASARDILIALMTAMQESGLRNLNYGDRDSVGLFQQRHTMGWGSIQQIMNPEYSARAFFLGAGTNKGLLDYKERNGWSLTQAAQQVQRSAFPDAYAKHEGGARTLLESLGDGKALEGTLGTVPGFEVDQPTLGEALTDTLGEHPALQPTPGLSDPLGEVTNSALDEPTSSVLGEQVNPALGSEVPQPAPDLSGLMDDVMLPNVTTGDSSWAGGWRGDVVDWARKMVGTPFQWGSASPQGVDRGGLLKYVYGKAGIDLPRLAPDAIAKGRRVGLSALMPGDLVAWDLDGDSAPDRAAIYLGGGKIIEASGPGKPVEVSNMYATQYAYGVSLASLAEESGANSYGPPGGKPQGVGVGQNLVTKRWRGLSFTVNQSVAYRFIGLLNDLRKAGYMPKVLGGYNNRNIAGTSTKSLHAYGMALDIDPGLNPVQYGSNNHALPANISSIARKWGLEWGGDWSSYKDPMHFSVAWGGRE